MSRPAPAAAGPAAAAALLAACASAPTHPAAQEFRGYFERGFESESFRPCGSDESWWVTDATELRTRYAAATRHAYEPVFVVVRGEVGPPGRYGHLGRYTRELSVAGVVELRSSPGEDACG